MTSHTLRNGHSRLSVLLVLLLVVSPIWQIAPRAQTTEPASTIGGKSDPVAQVLRLEKIEVAGGAELITVHANLRGIESLDGDNWVPLVSILRDTLGDSNKENDRLRYVWPLTYTTPTMKQRMAAAIPFFYTRVGSKGNSKNTPPPALDIAAPEKEVWNKLFWTALQNILLDTYGIPLKASTNTYRRNTEDYRKSHIIRALSVLTLYESVRGESAFSEHEMAEMQSRLLLTDKAFGGLVDETNLQGYYSKRIAQTHDERGHNWELLRQRAEAESLLF
jgi:hypothetical protein